MNQCPKADELSHLLANPRDERAWEALEQHLATCDACRQRLDTLTDVGALVADRGSDWRLKSSSSVSLQGAIDALCRSPSEGGPAARTGDPTLTKPAFLEPTDAPGFIGRLGEFQVRRVIGQGGMGIVLEAQDPVLKRTVALKMLSPWTVLSDEVKGRFLREAQSAAALTHENVVAIHAVEEAQGTPLLVLEYVAGQSLYDRVNEHGTLRVDQFLRLGKDIARGLAAAHAQGLVHRDIKPANILIDRQTGRAKIADFGLAKATGHDALTVAGTILGTPEFMSPQQASGQPADERSDLFSLGAVLYFAATGVSPFRGETLLATLDNVRRCQPKPVAAVEPSLPPWLCSLIESLLRRVPEERPATAAAVAELFERQAVTPAAAATRSSNWRPWALAALSIGALALIGLAIANRGGRRPQSLVQPPPNQPAVQPKPVESGFVIARGGQHFSNLSAALAAAEDRDEIEVHGHGPFLTGPQTLSGKRLTLRAAAGSTPVILFEKPTARATDPLIRTDSDLRMEGLQIQWAIEGQPGFSEEEMLDRSVIAVSHGRLVLAYCRIASDRFNGCVAASCRELYVRNCHFAATSGMGLFWRPSSGGRLDIAGTAIEGRFGLSLLIDGVALGNSPAELRLSHSTLAAERAVQVFMESPPREPLPFAADHNLVDAEYLFLLVGRRLARAKATSNPEEVAPVLRTAVAWSEDANLYRRGMQFVGRPIAGRPGDVAPADLVGVNRWLELWKLPAGKSVEGELILTKASESELSPPILGTLTSASGPQPGAIGAPADKLGPGPAYDAWRASPEYAAWPP